MTEHEELTASELDDKSLRYMLAQHLGHQVGEDSDYYDTFNWDANPGVDDYYQLYLRNPFARAITDIPVNTAWRDDPIIADDDEAGPDDSTEFEADVSGLVDTRDIWHYCMRADKLAGIGEYGILVLELDDISGPEGFDTEAEAAKKVTGLRPFSQANVIKLETGKPGTGRWGKPLRYKLDLSDDEEGDDDSTDDNTLWVHYSRVIHIPSEGLLDDEIRGTPRQEPVYNNLTDIQKTMGSAAELAYRASAWGLNVNVDKDFKLEDGGDALREQLDRWYYGLEPMLRTQGAEVNNLGGEDIDPSPVIDVNVEAISAQTGIPQSVLKGNETGERSTTQDLKEWYGKIQERRQQFTTPRIVRKLLDTLVDLGVLSEPSGEGYGVEWPPLAETSEKEISEIQSNRATVVQKASAAMPAFGSEEWRAYLEDGDLPELPDDMPEIEPMDADRPPEAQPDGA